MTDYLAMNEFPGTGAIMQVAISFAGNRPDDNSGTTPYFDPADVKGEIITPATATTVEVVEPVVLTRVNATTFKTDRIVATGKVLRVSRHTMTSYPMVDFVDRQIVTENDLDVSSRQVLYAAMEALDQSNLSIRYARQGLTFASAAVNTANTALGIAGAAADAAASAVATANAATGSAAAAVATANAASLKSDQALANASSAEQHAENVETLAARADAASAQALTTANEAKSIASGIDAKATDALSKSTAATQTANSAKATAEGIDAKATSAVQTANDAANKAASAKATAEGIEAKANSAQETASAAQQQATAAAGNASQALTTANNQAAAVSKAQSDASQALTNASSANDNANGRVYKGGDTMTGELVAPSFKAGNMSFANGALRNSNNTVLLTLNGSAVKTTGATNFELSPGDANNAQFIVYKNDGNLRGNFWNSPDGSWSIRTGGGKAMVLSNSGRLDVDGPIYGESRLVVRLGERVPAGSSNQFKFLSNGTNFGIQNGQGNEALQVNNGGNAAAGALMSFHREGAFAAYFGLDTDNQWAVGGWSMGSQRYLLWHEGNLRPADYVRYDNLRAELGGRGASEVGTTAFAFFNGSANPGDVVSGANLFWGSFNTKGGVIGGGNWRCMGYVRGDNATLWLRIN